MSFSRNSNTVPLSNSIGRSWADRMSNIFRKEISFHHIDHLPPVSVFGVPKALTFQKPEAYSPQLLALGPYHHLRPELYPMERYKLAAIQSISRTPEQTFQFHHLVINRLKELDPLTRACYSKFIDYDEDTLAWIIAIDGSFLIHHLWNSCSSLPSSNTLITRDVMMLENQIPYILLVQIRKSLDTDPDHDHDDNNTDDPELFRMFIEFCKLHSPLKITDNNVRGRTETNTRPRHLLELMYRLIVTTTAQNFDILLQDSPIREVPFFVDIIEEQSSSSTSSGQEEKDSEAVRNNFGEILDVVQSSLGNKQTEAILKPFQVMANIPWSSISGIFRKGTLRNGDGEEKSLNNDEIDIPSVWYLYRYADVKCRPIMEGGGLIKDVRFSEKDATLYLPVLNLDATSEVIFRNLVAYEAAMSKSSTGLEFARYVNLMNGIIDTAADVKLLKQNGVIVNSTSVGTVLTDDEIAQLFNGMKRFYVGSSSPSDQKSNVDVAIGGVNMYYDQKLVVRLRRQIKKGFHASWKSLGIISTILLLAVLTLQSFCQVYTCSRFWISSK